MSSVRTTELGRQPFSRSPRVAPFDQGSSVLPLPADPDDAERFERVRSALLAARSGRVQPARDDKIVTAWNGLAITALAEASVALALPPLLTAAARCASALLELHI